MTGRRLSAPDREVITENSLFSVIEGGKAIQRPAVAITNPLAGEPGVTAWVVRDKVWEN
jgi:hypothetical protein